MPTPIETFLTNIGLPTEDVTKITTIPEADQPAFDPKPYADKVRTNFQTQFQNDPAFFNEITLEKLPPSVKKQMESTQYARATNVSKEKIAKALGFTEAEIADLATDDYKALDYYVPAILEKWTKTKSGSKETQEQLIAERRKNEDMVKKYGPDYEKEVETKYQTAADKKVADAIFNANLIGELSAIPGLKIAAGDIAKTANDILQSKYAFERVGDYTVELRQKANPTMKVLKGNTSQELTIREALVEIATERGWVEVKPDGGKGSGTIPIVPNKNGTLEMVVPPHLKDKFKKKIEAEQG